MDISQLAEQCVVMVRARALAAWVGEARPVTAKGVLRRPDAAEAAKAAGIAIPTRFRSAADIGELNRAWLVAQAVGLVVVGPARVTPGPGTDADPPRAWLAGLDAALRSESHDKNKVGAAVVCRLVLAALATDPPPAGDQLEIVVHRMSHDLDLDDAIAMSNAFGSYTMPARSALPLLADFGVVDDRVRLTPLGRWAAEQLEARAVASAVTPDLSAGALLTRLAAVRDDEAWAMVRRWGRGRSVGDASIELLRAGAAATPAERVAAVDIVLGLGDEARPAWQAVADVPELAAHAHAALAAWDLRPEPDEAQLRWLAVEHALATLARDGVEAAYHDVTELGGLAAMLPSGHPGEVALSEAVAGFAASGQHPRVFQLKIELRHLRPLVWRRLLIPASATLGDLHEVIQIVMDWDGDHLHSFTADGVTYSSSYPGLDDASDEDMARLSRVMPAVGSVVTYVYDFGDWWEHVITLEKIVVDADPAATYPMCVAGDRDAPVEDWNPEFPEKPTPFDLGEINRRLAGLAGASSPR